MEKSKNTTTAKDKDCFFCVNGLNTIDYKDSQLLRRFISSQSKIMPKRRSGVCSKHQKKMAAAIKLARFMAILPYMPR